MTRTRWMVGLGVSVLYLASSCGGRSSASGPVGTAGAPDLTHCASPLAAHCSKVGAAGYGESCTETVGSTGCAEGLVCRSGSCAATCDFWDPGAECPGGESCSWYFAGGPTYKPSGLCMRQLETDAAPLGEACPAGSRDQAPCGFDGSTFRGVCANPCTGVSCEGCDTCPESGARCQPYCRTNDDCPADFPMCNEQTRYCTRWPPPPPP